MRREVINGKECFIGDGEDTTLAILKIFFPTAEFERQIPIGNYVSSEIYDLYDPVYKKASIDIGMWYMGHNFAIRVQGDDHTGDIKARKDRIQKKDIEDTGADIVDIFFRECPNIFKERLNWDSVIEFCNMFKLAKMKLVL